MVPNFPSVLVLPTFLRHGFLSEGRVHSNFRPKLCSFINGNVVSEKAAPAIFKAT